MPIALHGERSGGPGAGATLGDALLGARRDPPAARASPTRRAPPSSGRCRRWASTASAASGWARPSGSSSRPPTRRRARAHADEVCQRFLINPVIEAADITLRVVEHAPDEPPGSGSSPSPARTASSTPSRRSRRSAAEAELLWHGDDSVGARRRRRPPRGVRPRRLPPARGDRPLLARSWTRCASTPRRAARWSASATASRCSPRPGCCPGRCRRTAASSSSAPPRRSGSETTDSALTAEARGG